jgi:hypothetical protein
MRRFLFVVTAAVVMAAMMVAMAMPAFAAPNCAGRAGPHPSGQHRAHSNADDRGDVAQGEKHRNKEGACAAGVPPGEGHNK